MASVLMDASQKEQRNRVANDFRTQATIILAYTVGSGDMFYEEVAQRNVFIGGDKKKGFHMWAKCVNGEMATPVDLDEILLEGALASEGRGGRLESERLTDSFAQGLGRALARHVILHSAGESNFQRARLTLECILGSMHIPFTSEQIDDEVHYMFDHCPLCDAAERTGMRMEIALAHHELGSLIRSSIGFIDPRYRVRYPSDRYAQHTFAMVHQG